MFVLAEMKHVIRTPPHIFHLKLNDAIAEELNKKLANKVLLNVGLCIALHDITELEDSYIFPGDGASHTKVKFRYVVFRPFMEEVIIGKIRSCSREGVHEQAWVWEYNTGDGDRHDLFMDPGEPIRFRVTAETFVETSPTGPENSEIATTSTAEASTEEPKVPYMLTGSINESGLGLLTWWASS
ncbi:DNA-directed RNA polymerase III subunit RPC8 [Blattella germanica]|nr:DNA-directed RNA polymerase III subunit RPC8 [Blattella germanica]